MEVSKSHGISSTLMLLCCLKTTCNLGCLNVYSNNIIAWHSNLFDEVYFVVVVFVCLFVLTGKYIIKTNKT